MSAPVLSVVDGWAAAAAVIAAVALALRGELLKPERSAFFSGPMAVRLSITLVSILLGGRAVSIVKSGVHANAPEALVYSALAVSSLVLLVNLQCQRPRGTDGDQ